MSITDSVLCVGFALARDLPDIQDRGNMRRPYLQEVEVYSFPQGWGSTALGFGGVGGQAITEAQTTVILSGCDAAVYFGCRLAYVIRNFNTAFVHDVSAHSMVDVSISRKRYRTALNPVQDQAE